MALAQMAPFGTLRDVTFVSLQKDAPGQQARQPPAGLTLHDWTDELRDFDDTAALITALDLVISVDTALVHLTGALGKPVWVPDRNTSSGAGLSAGTIVPGIRPCACSASRNPATGQRRRARPCGTVHVRLAREWGWATRSGSRHAPRRLTRPSPRAYASLPGLPDDPLAH